MQLVPIMAGSGALIPCHSHCISCLPLLSTEGVSEEDSIPVVETLPSLFELRGRCRQQLKAMRSDHIRSLNATPYKVRATRHAAEDLITICSRDFAKISAKLRGQESLPYEVRQTDTGYTVQGTSDRAAGSHYQVKLLVSVGEVPMMVYLCGCLLDVQISVSAKLYNFIHDLWLAEAPVGELV